LEKGLENEKKALYFAAAKTIKEFIEGNRKVAR